jgi:hypothetical protein
MRNRQPLQHVAPNVSKLVNMRGYPVLAFWQTSMSKIVALAERRHLDVIDTRGIWRACPHERDRHNNERESLA